MGTDLEIWVRFRSWIEALPTPKRQCLLHSIGDTYREVFVRCLRQSAPGLTIPPLADTVGLPQDVLLLL